LQPRHAIKRTRRARHARTAPRASVARALAIAACAVLAFGTGGVATAYLKLQSNIRGGDIEALITTRPTIHTPDPEDESKGTPLNLVLIGSDDRSGENGSIGGYFGGMRSDTTILMHISADRDRIELVSIPRDLMTDIPACKMTNGKETVAAFAQFNESFAYGAMVGEDVESAAACTVATVEQMTDVYIDGYFVVDFSGFITMVDAIGGVEVCVEQEIYSPKANNLHLMPGRQELDGATALDFARARIGKGLGDGSDIGRIKRQQQLLAQTVNKVLSKNLLTQQVDLYRFLDAATRSLAADEEFASIPTLAGLAYSLRSIKGANITFMTPKLATYPEDRNRVIWADGVNEIWTKIARDEPLKEPKGTKGPKPSTDDGGPSGSPDASADPSPDAPASSDAPTPDETDEPEVDDGSLTPDDVAGLCG